VQQVDPRTIIVGAGAGGLAVASELRERGLEVEVLERSDAIAASWRGRYDSLRLHTGRAFSGLPGAPIPRRYGRWVRRDDLVAYLDDYARRRGIEPRFGVEVTGLRRHGDRWDVATTAGDYEADAVVLATGLSRTPMVPDWPGLAEFTGSFCHTADYREPSPYRGRSVLVVGAGNSASEIATELSGVAADVRLSVRRPPNIIRRDIAGVPTQVFGIALRRVPEGVVNVLTTAMRKVSVPDLTEYGLSGPLGDGFSQYLRTQTVPILDHGFVAAVRQRRIGVVAPIASIEGDAVRLGDGSVLRPDAIVAGTGYRLGIDALVEGLGVLDDEGRPMIGGVRTSPQAPGLYLVGLNIVLSGVLREIAFEARAVGRAIATSQLAGAVSAR
jgi:putative flavoprotein involved in K+ transport